MKKLILALLITFFAFEISAQNLDFFVSENFNFEATNNSLFIDTTQTNNVWQM